MNTARNTRAIWANIANALAIAVFLWIAAVIFSPFLGFLLPHKHDKANATSCASNLKQLGLGLVQYAQDNDNNLPNVAQAGSATYSWRTAIYPYLKYRGAYHCPSQITFDSLDGLPVSYAANDSGVFGLPPNPRGLGAFAPAGARPFKVTDLKDPSQLIALCEITGTASYDFDANDTVRFGNGSGQLWAGHTGASNYLFVDGHVKRLKPRQTISSGDHPRNLWYRDNAVSLYPAATAAIQRADH